MNAKKHIFILVSIILLIASAGAYAQTLTEVIFPQYIQGHTGTNNDRIPFAYRVTLSGLSAGATYRFINQCVLSTTAATSNGAGNIIFPNQSGSFTRSSGPNISTAGNYGTFTTDGAGSYTGWFVTEPSGNATFTAGNQVFMRINLNNGAGGTTVVTRLTTTLSATAVSWGTAASATQGTGIIGTSAFSGKNFVFLYDNTSGTGRPISGGFVEDDGFDLPDANYIDFFDTSVDAKGGVFGTIIPNVLASGIQRIEEFSIASASSVSNFTSATAIWTGKSTINPTGGSATPISILVGLPDDPNIAASTNSLYISSPDSVTTGTAQFSITNNGADNDLTISNITITGPGASAFSIEESLPDVISTGTATLFTVKYYPDGSETLTTATLSVISNDQSSDVPQIALYGKAAPDVSPYAGLLISEIVTQPTADEYIEIVNVTGDPINLEGVIISDEDENNTEGALKFPAGTSIASREVILIAVNNSSTEPSWLDTIPAGIKVFYESARTTTTWAAANGNTLIQMENYSASEGGTSDAISLSSGDGIAIYAPGTTFVSGIGPFPLYTVNEGMNYPQGDTGPSVQINSTGQYDVPSTKAGTAQPASGNGLTRVDEQLNTNSFLRFTEQAATPGVSSLSFPAAVNDWSLLK